MKNILADILRSISSQNETGAVLGMVTTGQGFASAAEQEGYLSIPMSVSYDGTTNPPNFKLTDSINFPYARQVEKFEICNGNYLCN